MAAERGRSSTSHATQVCYVCKARKKKCNKLLPSCGYCVRKGLFCEYGLKAQDNSNPLLHSASLQPEAAIVEATALHRKVLELIRGTGYFVDDLSARYFQTLHSYLPVICRTTFHRSLTTLGAIPSAGFSVLLLIVCLAASASPKPAWNIRRAAFKPAVNPRALYLATKSILAQVQVGFPPSVQLIQARLLLALYEYEHGQPEDAFDSIAGCARMAYAARLQNPNSAALVQSSDLNNMPSKPDIAAQMHKEEAANTWWGIVICERISYCEIALSEQPLITTIPVDDSGLPTEPETMEYGESEGLETAPVIAVSFLNSPGIGGFGRSAQSAWLLDKVITAVEVPDIHARLVQLEKLDSILQKFLSSLLKQQEQKAVAFCEAIAITIRALIILHNHVLHVLRHSRTSISPTFGARGEWPAHSQAALDATTTIILDIIDIHEGFDSVAPSFSYIVQASLEYVRSKPNWKDNSWYCSAEARLRCSLDKFHQFSFGNTNFWPLKHLILHASSLINQMHITLSVPIIVQLEEWAATLATWVDTFRGRGCNPAFFLCLMDLVSLYKSATMLCLENFFPWALCHNLGNAMMAESAPPKDTQPQAHRDVVVQPAPDIANGIVSTSVEDFMNLVHEANEANEREREMKLVTAFRVYPKAILWSIILSSTLIMEGYDTSLVGAFNAYPSFLNVFGIRASDGTLNIPPSWQNGIAAATNCGEIIGLQVAGVMSDRVGYRWTLILALVCLTGFIFIPFYAKTLTIFLIGELLQGISWGVFQTMTTAYAAEVCPVPLRHYLTTFVNLCWIIGQFISAGILRGLVNRQDVWGYKIPFAVQWAWPIPIGIGIFLAPESPWWCVRKGYTERARNALRRLTIKNSSFTSRDEDRQIAYMIYTNAMEEDISKGTSYLDCFRGTDIRRSEIVCMTWIAQTFSGTAIGGLSSYFYVRAGISTQDSYSLSWGQTAISAVGTMTSWLVLDRLGRKSLMCGGMVVMFVLLLVAGGMGIPSAPSTATSWTAGTMVLLLSAVADFSVAPVVYAIVSEIPSTRLRAKSIILARNAYNIINLAFVNIVSYRQLNASAWNWGPKACFFWAGINLLMNIYLYFRLPETKGRTYAELDILFANNIPARKFSSTKIETIINLDTNPEKVEVVENS